MTDYKKSTWNGFEMLEFQFEGREARLVIPKKANGGRWLIKTEYFGAFPDLEIEMLRRGYHVAYVANETRWMKPDDVAVKARLADFLSRELSLAKKCVPVGMSCGGLHAVYFAAEYPDKIAAMYLDAPVLNLLSCPAHVGREVTHTLMDEFVKATGMTLHDLICYREHPIDKKDILLSAGIPIFLVYGDADDVVPYSENGALLERFYREGGGEIVTVCKNGCAHHPHGLEDSTPIADFIDAHYAL